MAYRDARPVVLALSWGGVPVGYEVARALGAPLEVVVAMEPLELARRVLAWREARPQVDYRDRTVLLVDDGLTLGATAGAAILSLRRYAPRALVIAVPVCAATTLGVLLAEVDAVVCARSPTDLAAVGQAYEDHGQTSDEEVQRCLGNAAVG